MFNLKTRVINRFSACLQTGYRQTYGSLKPEYGEILGWASQMALEILSNSDALYHNVEHTLYVTLAGQEILRGKHILECDVSCEDWLHFMLSLLFHDIGFVRGVCQQDRDRAGLYATGIGGEMVLLSEGTTDASLNAYHIDRGKLFIAEHFSDNPSINTETIKRNLELTRFPVPADEFYKDTVNYPGLVRAADLIGQLSDPYYLQKINALFYEFEEIGMNQVFGYRHPGDIRKNYPSFFWNVVIPYIQPALRHLAVTQEGKQIAANLYGNVLQVEHESELSQLMSCR